MTLAVKIIGIVVAALVFSVVLKGYRPEYSLAVVIAATALLSVVILKNTVPEFRTFFDTVNSSTDTKYIETALKALVISLLTSLTADTCRDHGQSALALVCETAGKGIIFILCIPMCISVTQTALGFLKL